MNERKYRALLICALAAVLLCGAILFLSYGGRREAPAEGTLVRHCEFWKDRMAA